MLTIYQELHQPHLLVMVWAGLAVVAMKQGEVETAQSYASQLLAALTEHLIVNEYNTYYLVWQVFQWLALPQADEVLAVAARDIQMYLDNISDPQAQAVYLARPPLQPLWDAWQEMGKEWGFY